MNVNVNDVIDKVSKLNNEKLQQVDEYINLVLKEDKVNISFISQAMQVIDENEELLKKLAQ